MNSIKGNDLRVLSECKESNEQEIVSHHCPNCNVGICPNCHQEYHEGECEESHNEAFIKMIPLEDKKKWKRCPKCKEWVNRYEGCLHLDCVCGGKFCFECLKDYRESGCGSFHCKTTDVRE